MVAVLPRDFRARERSPRLSAITISSTRGSDASSRVMILPSPPVPRIAACTSHRSGRRRLEVSTSFSSGERRSACQIHDALCASIDVEPVSAGETDEGHAEFLRDGHREAGRRSDRNYEGDARDGRFLQDLEAAPPAHREDRTGQGSSTGEERLPDDLVDRVVSPDVLAQTRQLTRGVEQSGRVEPSRLGKQSLVFSEPLRNRGDRLRVERGLAGRNRMTDGDADGLEGGLPADAARGGHVEVAREAVRAELYGGPEDRAHDVVLLRDAGIRAVFDSRDIPLAGYDSLGEQESRGQFEVVAGRAHRHRQGGRLSLPLRAALHADLHRLLRRKLVRLLTRAGTAHLPDRGGRRLSRAVS